jgi:DNA-binding IclR family transcriptional regulator
MAGRVRQRGQSMVGKLVAILDAFDVDQPRVRASDVSRRSGLPFSTVHRLLGELVRYGILDHAPGGNYSVGIRLWEVAALHPQLTALRRAAIPLMCELREALGSCVHLNVPVGAEVLCVEELAGVRSDRVCQRLGGRSPLLATAGGRVLVAYMEPDRLRQLMTAPPPAGPNGDGLAWLHTHQAVDIRRVGVALGGDDARLTVAAPVVQAGGVVLASLEVHVARPTDAHRLAPALRAAAGEVAHAADPMRTPPASARAADPAAGNGHRRVSALLPIQWGPHGRRPGH